MEFKKHLKLVRQFYTLVYKELGELEIDPYKLEEEEESLKKRNEFLIRHNKLHHELINAFHTEYEDLTKRKVYFLGCSFKIYKETYHKRLLEYTTKYEDASEIDFIEAELDKGVYHMQYKIDDMDIIKSLTYSINKRVKFIEERLHHHDLKLESSIELDKYKRYIEDYELIPINKNITEDIKTINSVLKWEGNQTELVELAKALIENGSVKGKQKDIISTFEKFFDIEIKNPDKLIIDIKNRNTGSETLFLDKLKSSLYNYMTKENIR